MPACICLERTYHKVDKLQLEYIAHKNGIKADLMLYSSPVKKEFYHVVKSRSLEIRHIQRNESDTKLMKKNCKS